MQNFPHEYVVTATAKTVGDIELSADRLATLNSAAPAEFDGPGDMWSPETLLVGAVADCLALTFRGVARASGLAWTSLQCDVTGTLDRIERTTRFVAFDIHARLRVAAGTDPDRARAVLEKAEKSCLIANSLSAAIHLIPTIEVASEQSPISSEHGHSARWPNSGQARSAALEAASDRRMDGPAL